MLMRNVMRASGISLCSTGALSSVPNNRSAGRSICMYLRPLQYALAIHHRWPRLLEVVQGSAAYCGPKGRPTC
jgi:hypothetical protein